jgi:hypothetical protein
VKTSLGELFVIDRSDMMLLAPGSDIWITLGTRGTVIVPGGVAD